MILYHAVTYIQILWIVVHHKLYTHDKQAVLILADSLKSRLSAFTQTKLQNHFEVYYLPYTQIKGIPYEKSLETKNEYIQTSIENIYNDTIPYSLEEFEEIYIAGCHFYISLILIKHRIPFNIIEEAVGMLSQSDLLYSIVEKLNPLQLEIAIKNQLLDASHPLIKNKFCSVIHQKEDLHDDKVVDFNILENLQLLDEDSKYEVISIFLENPVTYPIRENSILLLTQCFANLKITTFEDQVLIYQLFADYFVKEKYFVIKKHPDDLIYYPILFPEACIIKESFPSELLPIVFDQLPETVATISSTAIFSIKPAFKNALEFNVGFETEFRCIHKYYLALNVLTQNKNAQKIQIFGCNSILMNQLVQFSDLKDRNIELISLDCIESIQMNLPIIFDQVNEEDLQNSELNINEAIFLNSSGGQNFYFILNHINTNYLLPLVIDKQAYKKEYFFSDTMEEIIYYYNQEEYLRDMINHSEVNIDLKHTGMKLSKKTLSNEEIQIKVLEGILKTTEERLKYYIEKNTELSQFIEELETHRLLNKYIEKEKQLSEEIEKLQQENQELNEQLNDLKSSEDSDSDYELPEKDVSSETD